MAKHTCNDNYFFHALFHLILFVVNRETKAFLDHVDQKASVWVLFSKIQVQEGGKNLYTVYDCMNFRCIYSFHRVPSVTTLKQLKESKEYLVSMAFR